jgi:hypothetical protein
MVSPLSAQPTAESVFGDLTEDDAGTQRFSANALEQAPAGGGGGGGLTQQQVRDALKLAASAGSPAAGSIDDWVHLLVAARVNKLDVDRTTGDITIYDDDGVTPLTTRRITEISDSVQALVPQP